VDHRVFVPTRLGHVAGALLAAATACLTLIAGPAVAGPAVADPAGGDGSAEMDGWAHAGAEGLVTDAVTTEAAPNGYPVRGIDVSHYQHIIDWTDVARGGAIFSYAKATEGTHFVDRRFEAHNAGAKRNGLYVGAYHFGRPDRSSGRAQADYFLDRAQYTNDGRTLPPMLDIEWPYRSKGRFVAPHPCWGKSSGAIVRWIRDFVTRVRERTGSPTMIYTNPNWWNPCTDRNRSFGDNYLFISNYTGHISELPAGWSRWTLWQYANGGKLPGDQNVFNGSLFKLARLARKPAEPMPQQVVGDWDGDGVFTPGVVVPEGKSWRWLLSNNLNGGPADISFSYGDVKAKPVVGDWDGDHRFTPGVVMPEGEDWRWLLSNDLDRPTLAGAAADISFTYGEVAATPIVGDWDGNGTFTPGVVDETGERHDWDLSNGLDGKATDIRFDYGDVGTTPVVGDWDGNGTFTPGVVDETGERHDWDLSNGLDGDDTDIRLGSGDIASTAVVGDWDGNGTYTPGVVDPATLEWRLFNHFNASGADLTFTYGASSAPPVSPAPTTSPAPTAPPTSPARPAASASPTPAARPASPHPSATAAPPGGSAGR
jgi:GH25 family lysozyme M1 (1,4-beta-N-acetylmuramidase)